MAEEAALAPARHVNWEDLLSRLTVDIVEGLRADETFMNAQTAREQCYHACRILRLERVPAIPYSMIGRILDLDKGTVQRHFRKAIAHMADLPQNGRPPIISHEEQEQLITAIQEAYDARRPMTIGEVHYYIETRFHKSIDRNTLMHMLRREPRLRSCHGIPMEEARVDVTAEVIWDFFRRAMEVVEGVPAHFVFNMDEMGHQDWADRKVVTCIVPASHVEKQVNVPVSRAGKRITLMASIAADGSALKPEIIIPRKTVDADLVLTGLTSEKVLVRSQPHGFVNTQLFDDWLETIFIPELVERRARFTYNGPAVLLLDNCSAHIGVRFSELCQENHVIPCYFPPHSSHQLQPLDLCLFGITKRFLTRANKLDAANIQTKHISSVVCAFLAAAVPLNIVKTFELSGISLVSDEGTLLCTVRPELAKRVLVPLPVPMPEIPNPGSENSDEEELRIFVEECAQLLYDLDLENEQYTASSIHSFSRLHSGIDRCSLKN
jgi:hypothetical protein